MEQRNDQSRVPRRLSRTKRIILPVLLVIFGLLLIEVASRLTLIFLPDDDAGGINQTQESVWAHEETVFHEPDPDLFWRMIPSFSSGTLKTNPDGFRGPDLLGPKPPETFRIVLMGNSVTFGYKVGEPEIFATRLHELLEAQRKELATERYRYFEVINLGVSGYSSMQGRILYEKRVRALAPDLLVVMYGYNDHHGSFQTDAEKYADRGRERLRLLARKTGIVRLAGRIRGQDRSGLRKRPVPRVGLDEFEENILSIRDASRSDGIECVFLTIAIRPEIPLVEDFRPFRGSAPADTVWMRQIDYATQWMDPQSRGIVMNHFFFGADLGPFIRQEGNCTKLFEIAKRDQDLPIYLYLLARCFEAAGLTERAQAAMNECAHLDEERRQIEVYNDRLRLMASRSEIRLLDLAAVFAGQGDRRSLFLDAVHPSPLGHDLIARTLRDSLFAAPAAD